MLLVLLRLSWHVYLYSRLSAVGNFKNLPSFPFLARGGSSLRRFFQFLKIDGIGWNSTRFEYFFFFFVNSYI